MCIRYPLASALVTNGSPADHQRDTRTDRQRPGTPAPCGLRKHSISFADYCVWRIAMVCQLRLLATVWFSIVFNRVTRARLASAVEKEQRDDMTSKINSASKNKMTWCQKYTSEPGWPRGRETRRYGAHYATLYGACYAAHYSALSPRLSKLAHHTGQMRLHRISRRGRIAAHDGSEDTLMIFL